MFYPSPQSASPNKIIHMIRDVREPKYAKEKIFDESSFEQQIIAPYAGLLVIPPAITKPKSNE